jgi:thiol:disulfide interchange protein
MLERRQAHVIQSVVITLLLLIVAAGVRAASLPATFDPARDGAADVAYALSLAKAQGKRVIVDVGGEWCTWCHVLDRFIAANDDVRDAIDAHYVWVKVNFSKQNENAALLARWPKVAGYPHLFVLDASGAVVLSQDTEALEGGRTYDKARFLAFLAKAADAPSSRAAASYGPSGLVGKPTYVF